LRKGLTIEFFGLLLIGLALGLFSYTRNSENRKYSPPFSPSISYQPNPAYLKLLSSSQHIAKIGSVELTKNDLNDQLKYSSGNAQDYHSLSENDLSLRVQKAFDEVVEDELLAQEAMRRGINPSSTSNQPRRELSTRLVQAEVSQQPPITDAAEREFYKNHGEKFTLAPSNRVRELFVPFTAQDHPEKKAGPSYQKAKNLAERIRSGESLEALARKYVPRTVEKAAGYSFTGAVMDGDEAAAVLHLNPGVVAGPFRVEGGLSIFQGISRIPQRFIPFYKAQPTIHQYLEEQRSLELKRKLVEQLSQKIMVWKLDPSAGKL
jgi:parvulin-like peptidyl-prolyl isomerase